MHKMISHSIRYNLLVGWTTFCLQTFNSLWHRFSKELETFLRFWCWHDSITPLLQTCGLLEAVRFGDCGCHLSWTHCHALSFVTRPVMEAAIWGWVHSSYKDQVDGFYDAQLVQRSVSRKYPLHQYTMTTTTCLNHSNKANWAVFSSCFMANSDPAIAVELEIPQTRHHFF